MKIIVTTAVLLAIASIASAQSAAPAPKRATVCAEAVKMYADIKEIPVPHDTVQIPMPEGPVRVTNEAEMEAAELALKKRAGSVGATGILAITQEVDDGSGAIRMSRRMTGVFVRADSAAAQKTCTK